MKAYTVLLCLAVIYCSYSVVVLQSSPYSTTIVSPAGATPVYSYYYNYLQSGFLGSGISWITSSKATSPIHYQALFYSKCVGDANLTITAASYFYVYLDGVYIGFGYNHYIAYRFPIKLTCGNHNLTVYVYFPSSVS
jgi:hypothetical protein